jgi:phosphoribosylformylglycinamidine synthase
MVGMVGLIENAAHYVTQDFKQENDVIVLLGSPCGSLAGSEYLRLVHKQKRGNPGIDLEFEKKVQAACLAAIQAGVVKSAHDPSEGGLAVCVAESCISNPHAMRGARIEVDALARHGGRLDEILFGEAPSRIVVTVAANDLARLEAIATKQAVPCFKLGTVGGDQLVITNQGANAIALSLRALSETWRRSIPVKAGLPAPGEERSDGDMKKLYDNIQDYINTHWD